MRTKKSTIENEAISGIEIDPRDVARVSRDGGTVTYRHAWAEGVDGRIWHGVSRAARKLARETANRRGVSVDVCSADGQILDVVDPDPEARA